MHRWIRSAASHQIVALLLIVIAILPASPMTTGVSAASRRPLPGHVPANLGQLTKLGPLAQNQPMTLTIALRPRASNDLTRQAVTPGTHLGVAEVAARYGQSDATIQSLGNYLAGYGLTIAKVSPDHLSLQVQGTVSQVQSALGVSLVSYVDRRGRRVYSTTVDPQLPVSLADSVEAVFGLENVLELHPLHKVAPPQVQRDTSGSQPGYYTPADMQAAYDLAPLYNQGLNGSNQTIGIIGCDTFNTSDIQTFSSTYGLPSPSISVANVDGGGDGKDVETTMDLEWSHAIAPNANLRYYGFPQCSLQGFLDAVAAASNENTAKVVSISLGACEADYAQTSYLSAMENQFQVASAEGISVLVASGDSGAYCDTSSGMSIDVSYPASSAFVTAVGGTSLSLDVNGGYGTETAWGYWYAAGDPWGSGGGYSTVIAEPSWQSQANISDASGKRAVPDIAWNADPHTGNYVYFQGQMQYGWGGTSIAAPQWAGLIAIADQANGKPFGLLGPVLYGSTIRNLQSRSDAAYHDVTEGNNLNYSATTGWDAATGWGSAIGCNVVKDMVSPSVGSGAPSNNNAAYHLYLPYVAANASGRVVYC